MPASHDKLCEALVPGENYEQRASDTLLAEANLVRVLRSQKVCFWESFFAWILLIGIACATEQTIAAISALGWLMFVGGYYLPWAAKRVATARETLRIRVAFLSTDDAETISKTLDPRSRILAMIEYRKGLEPCLP